MFDWTRWHAKAEPYTNSPEAVAGADLVTLQKLLTAHARAERFFAGHLCEVFKSGHLTAILRRVKVLRASVAG